jgi:SAM-dependent methyltransferase
MTPDEAGKLERERRDADARYNDALTALDRAIMSLDGRDPSRDDVGRVGSALLYFLQQITAFVETKDRQLAAEDTMRSDALARAIGSLDELKTQAAVLRRAVESFIDREPGIAAETHAIASPPSPSPFLQSPTPQSAIRNAQSVHDFTYVAFEDQFRGSDTAIEDRLRAYVPIFAGCTDVLDIGCGRGELLAALRAAGIPARGIDANGSMVAAARERGLDATRADALACVDALPRASLGGVVATQVVEHLEPAYLMRLLDGCARAMRPGAPIVLETINPACWLAFFSSYIRDLTHVRPVHPETLQYLLRASGFERVELRYSAPVPDDIKMKTIDLPPAVIASADPTSAALVDLAHTVNANAVILNNLMFTHMDYAALGYRS